jgi:hypothetical protein
MKISIILEWRFTGKSGKGHIKNKYEKYSEHNPKDEKYGDLD